MTTFGSGSQLAAQCPRVATPDGWRPWTDADGPIPDAIMSRAQAMIGDSNVALGATESFPLPGVMTLIRIEPRVWSRDTTGALIEGCFRVAGIYLPSATPLITEPTVKPPEEGSGLAKTVGILTAASLALGIVGSIVAWSK